MSGIPKGALWVRMPRFIGDGILIAQSLEPLRQAGHPLVAWGPERVVDLYRGSSAFSAIHPDEPSGRNVLVLARTLRRHQASGVLSLARSLRPLLAGWLARVPLRIGWEEGGGRRIAPHSAPFWELSLHHFDRYQALVGRAFPGLPPAAPRPFRLWAEAAAAGPWTALLRGLEAEGLAAVPSALNQVGALGLAETAAFLRHARGLVGNDSALAHLTAAVGCPAVVAFGPTRPEWTAPRGAAVRVVRREDLPCLPCAVHGCTTPGHPCMQDLPAERLLAPLREILLSRPGAGDQAHP